MDSKSSLNKTIEKLNQLPNRNRNAFKNIYYTQPNTMNVAAEWIKKHIKCSSNFPLKVVDFSAGVNRNNFIITKLAYFIKALGLKGY